MAEDAPQDAERTTSAGLFDRTRWSVVRRAQQGSETALGALLQDYRRPLLVWLRAQRYSPHDAEDHLQGFFAALLRRGFLRELGQQKGKFRTFLLKSLERYLNDVRDKAGARKRGGGQPPTSIHRTDEEGRVVHEPPSPGPSPDREYDLEWARTVLANSLRTLERECARTGHTALCKALEPVMFADESASTYREIGERLGMREGAVKVAAFRIRARLRDIIQEEILQTVDHEEALKDELRYLFSLFAA